MLHIYCAFQESSAVWQEDWHFKDMKYGHRWWIFDLVYLFYGLSTPYGLFNAETWFTISYMASDLVWFYGISIIVGCLMPNPFYTYIFDIHDIVWNS